MAELASITVTGLQEIVDRFGSANQIVAEELEDAADSVLAEGITILSTYPAPRPGSTYERTNDLKRGWTEQDRTIRVGRELSFALVNKVPYSGYVQGVDQAWMHKGRWDTVIEVQAEIDRVGYDKLNAAAERIASRLQGGG